MRLVHMADLHLGFRQHQRVTPAGVNQREADVAQSFTRAIDMTIQLAPDLVLIGGDVFHAVRPSNPAILHAFGQLTRLGKALPETRIVMVAGNHDTPRTAETGYILDLFKSLGVEVVRGEPRRIEFADQGLSVLAVPDMPSGRPALTPNAAARYNVLLLHGEIAGVLPESARSPERSALEISEDELGAARWDYVALGHYHVHHSVAPNAFYSGSLDYTSADPWGEIRQERGCGIHAGLDGGKGIIEWDLATGTYRWHPLRVSRPLVELARIDAAGMAAGDIDEAIQRAIASSPVPVDDNIVRLVVLNVPRHVARQMDPKALRELKRRAMHFNLDIRRPEVARRSASGAPWRRPSLAEVLREKLESRVLAGGVDRTTLVNLGLEYLDRADRIAAPTPLSAEL